MKGSQLGASESGCNWIGYVIHHAPGPMLAVQPTVELAKRFSPAADRSADRGEPGAAREGGAGALAGQRQHGAVEGVPGRHPGDDRRQLAPSACARCRCAICSSTRSTPIRRRPTTRAIRWRWPRRARGPSPGGARCSWSRRRRSRGCRASSGSTRPRDQRRFFVPCPHCGHMQWLEFERLRWEKGRPETAAYRLRGLRAADRRAAQDGDAGRGRMAADGGRRRPADGGLPPLQPLLAGRLAELGADRPGLGGVPRHRTRR